MSDPAVIESDPLIGVVLASRYQIEVRLGEGAMGSVYKARHVKVGRPFAVKILHKKLLEDRKVAQRFEREAELAGRLRHPNVIGVVDVGETPDGTRYMVMDFAEGDDLATLLAEAPMPPERVVHLVRQILEGLYHAHEAGLIHRDLKPENVIVERDDHGTEVPRLVDFGIAILREGGDSSNADGRLTTNGLVLGTPHYMAPEQAVADPIDHRIDLFALGIVIYEMLCGKLPFDGTGAEVARANLLLDPPAIATRVPYLEVDPLLEAFARLLMAKKREARPPTAKAARELLDLITHDRRAAATALGAPMTAARIQTPTAPASPLRTISDAPSGDMAIAQAPTDPAPEVARTRQHSIPTDVAKPLNYSDEPVPPKRRSRALVFGIGGALVAALVVVLLIASGSESSTPKLAATPPAEPVVMQPVPVPAPPVETPPAPPPVEQVAAAGSAEEIAMGPEAVGSGSAAPVKSPGTGKPPKKIAKAVPPPIAKVETPIPAINAKAVADRYRRVGQQLSALQQTIGADQTSEMWTRYRRIRIQQALSTPALLQDAERVLLQLEKDIATRSK